MRNKKPEIFEWGSLRFRVVETKGCDGCYWYADGACVSPPEFDRDCGGCASYERVDKRNVVFIEEKE
ncbi:MAG: hypothetical protein J6K25_10395 [Thermoguttaceae bacterium]|nr:hypothetical protein [Thermoguttaceae bacterium]